MPSMCSRPSSSIRWPRLFNSCKPNNFPGNSIPCRRAAVAFSVAAFCAVPFPSHCNPLWPSNASVKTRSPPALISILILPGPGREVSAVYFKLRVGDVKVDLDRLDRFDRGATTHCFSVTLDHFANRRWRAAASKQRDCNYDDRDYAHQIALPVYKHLRMTPPKVGFV